jgi:hypothetical protein
MAMPASLSPAQRRLLVATMRRDRIMLSLSDRLLWWCGWLVPPYAFQSMLGRLVSMGSAFAVILLWLAVGDWAKGQGQIGAILFWLVPALLAAGGVMNLVSYYLPATGSWRARLWARFVAVVAALVVIQIWYSSLLGLAPFGLQDLPPESFFPGMIGALAGALVGPWRKRRRLRERGLERWPAYVEAALIEEVF